VTSSRRAAWIAFGVAAVAAFGVALGLAVSTHPVPYEATVTLREGGTMFDFAEALEEAGVVSAEAFLAACRDPGRTARFGIPAADAEGFLFPDTYRFNVPTPADAVVDRLLRAFERKAAPMLELRAGRVEDLGRIARRDGRIAAVILASIVEAETGHPPERPSVASVLINRLTGRDPTVRRLQADPTVGYGCRRQPELASCLGYRRGVPTRAMLDDRANRYNSYRHDGLPPGPIGNPGVASLRAVLDAPETRWLYYVSRGDGTHAFNETYEGHRRDVRKYLGR
jgi:UPF0755 protein